MRALIVGTGFGNLYKSIYESMGWNVTTVDIADPSADYDSIDKVVEGIDIAHICTPNFTHYELADKAAKRSNIVLVEKPGVATSEQWEQLLDENSSTRFMMVKNNQYRNNIQEMIAAANNAKVVQCFWINNDRIPKPGSWFTTEKLAFGGVSRDLLPHMLSLYQMFNPHWSTTERYNVECEQHYELKDITDSDYGEVDINGTYDVDDWCSIFYNTQDTTFVCAAEWRSMVGDDIAVYCDGNRFGLGLCPEEAYERMIKTAHSNLTNDNFWNEQKEMDLWIHKQLETL
jgi:predicted dehydrogenase